MKLDPDALPPEELARLHEEGYGHLIQQKPVESLDDGLALDVIGQMLDGKSPYPESAAFIRIRGLIRETGRACADPPRPPEDDGTTSGFWVIWKRKPKVPLAVMEQPLGEARS